MGVSPAGAPPDTGIPAAVELFNDGQHTQVMTNFESPLGATVLDAQGLPVAGVEMKVTVESGDARLVQVSRMSPSSDGKTAWAETNSNGQIIIVIAAGAEAGPVVVSASIVDPLAPEMVRRFHLYVDQTQTPSRIPPTGLDATAMAVLIAALLVVGVAFVAAVRRSRPSGGQC